MNTGIERGDRAAMHPAVYFVVLNWNNYNDTAECVQSLEELDYPSFKIVIVDNHSTDCSGQRLKERFPHHHVLMNTVNSGYSGGNNRGIDFALKSGARYVVIVNNDIVIRDKFLLRRIVDGMETTRTEILGPRIVCHETDEEVSVYNRSPWWNLVRSVMIRDDSEAKSSRKDYNSLLLLGSFLVVRGDVFGRIGNLNEEFFMYCEENELLLRANLHCLNITYFPEVNVYRKMGKDGKQYHIRRLYYMSRNKVKMFKLHASGAQMAFLFLINFISDVKKIVLFLSKGQVAFASTILRGLLDGANNVAGMKKEYH